MDNLHHLCHSGIDFCRSYWHNAIFVLTYMDKILKQIYGHWSCPVPFNEHKFTVTDPFVHSEGCWLTR